MEIKINTDKPFNAEELKEVKEGLEKLFSELSKPEIKKLVKKAKDKNSINKLKLFL